MIAAIFYAALSAAYISWVHEMYITENMMGFLVGFFIPPVGAAWGVYDLLTTPFS